MVVRILQAVELRKKYRCIIDMQLRESEGEIKKEAVHFFKMSASISVQLYCFF